ncbi:hypothetical protein D9758_008036 [Tetrapyrgos nigripes]|uniref:Uncharacterized protein n=1 Tax=Tetrapyrgos nigripes TaxID=182062 RepID=A0A8H5D0F4_9AGAR|nr:hypothetical protein D9758_008036 [Tetrapyrgos nigripes]
MSFWSPSASSKWAEDVAMASVNDRKASAKSRPVDLPVPITQTQPPPKTLPGRVISSIKSLCSQLNSGVRERLATPSTGNFVVHENLRGRALGLKEDDDLEAPKRLQGDDEEVDEVVVDLLWMNSAKASSASDDGDSTSTSHSELQRELFTPASYPRQSGFGVLRMPWLFSRAVVWPLVKQFFDSRFKDRDVEMEYRKEDWVHSKRLALWASIFFILNWIFGAIFIPAPAVLADKIYYYAFEPIFSLPLFLMCAYDWPRDHSNYYQVYLTIATWTWSYYQVLFGFLCGYSGDNNLFTCGSKDFLSTFYYTTALQTIALFGTGLKRLPTLVGGTVFLVLSAVLIIPKRDAWARNVINFALFQIFILYVHYRREQAGFVHSLNNHSV